MLRESLTDSPHKNLKMLMQCNPRLQQWWENASHDEQREVVIKGICQSEKPVVVFNWGNKMLAENSMRGPGRYGNFPPFRASDAVAWAHCEAEKSRQQQLKKAMREEAERHFYSGLHTALDPLRYAGVYTVLACLMVEGKSYPDLHTLRPWHLVEKREERISFSPLNNIASQMSKNCWGVIHTGERSGIGSQQYVESYHAFSVEAREQFANKDFRTQLQASIQQQDMLLITALTTSGTISPEVC